MQIITVTIKLILSDACMTGSLQSKNVNCKPQITESLINLVDAI